MGGGSLFGGGCDLDYRDHIVRDPKICGGQPVFKGTRVLLRTVLDSLAEGDSFDALKQAFPSLTGEHLRAAVAFAAAAAAEDLPPPNPVPTFDATQA